MYHLKISSIFAWVGIVAFLFQIFHKHKCVISFNVPYCFSLNTVRKVMYDLYKPTFLQSIVIEVYHHYYNDTRSHNGDIR